MAKSARGCNSGRIDSTSHKQLSGSQKNFPLIRPTLMEKVVSPANFFLAIPRAPERPSVLSLPNNSSTKLYIPFTGEKIAAVMGVYWQPSLFSRYLLSGLGRMYRSSLASFGFIWEIFYTVSSQEKAVRVSAFL